MTDRDPPHTLTAGQLIELLQDFDPQMKVVAVYDYGDYHHTPAVTGFRGVYHESLTETGYSSSGWEAPGITEDDNDLAVHVLHDYLVLR